MKTNAEHKERVQDLNHLNRKIAMIRTEEREIELLRQKARGLQPRAAHTKRALSLGREIREREDALDRDLTRCAKAFKISFINRETLCL